MGLIVNSTIGVVYVLIIDMVLIIAENLMEAIEGSH